MWVCVLSVYCSGITKYNSIDWNHKIRHCYHQKHKHLWLNEDTKLIMILASYDHSSPMILWSQLTLFLKSTHNCIHYSILIITISKGGECQQNDKTLGFVPSAFNLISVYSSHSSMFCHLRKWQLTFSSCPETTAYIIN